MICFISTRGLDFTPADDSHLPPDTPIIVVLHGLTGGVRLLHDKQLESNHPNFLKVHMNRT